MIKRVKTRYAQQDLHFKEMILGASVSFLLRILGAATQFVFSVVVARLFGVEGFGIYALALSITVIASIIGRWGLDQAALKHMSVFAEQGKWGAVKETFSKAFLMVVGLAFVVTFCIFYLSSWISETLFNEPELISLLQIMAFGILPFAVLNLIAESLRALKRIGIYTLLQGVLVPMLSMIFLIGSCYISDSVNSVAYAYIAACYFSLIVAFLLWKRVLEDIKGQDLICFVKSKALLKTATPMAWVTLVGVMMSFSETILLGVFHSSSEVGVYAAALRLALLINFVIIAFNSILAPKFAALYQQNALSDMKRLISSSVRVMFFLTLPVFAVFFIFPDQLLLVFSPDFTGASTTLVILAVGQLFNILAGPVATVLLMTGYETVMRKNVIIAAATSFSLGVALIPVYGVVGAACSATAGMIVLNYLSSWSVWKKIGIKTVIMNPFLFGK